MSSKTFYAVLRVLKFTFSIVTLVLFLLQNAGKYLPQVPVLHVKEPLSNMLYSYLLFSLGLLFSGPSSPDSEDRQVWSSLLFYCGGLLAVLVHGFTYNTEDSVSFYVALLVVLGHSGLSGYLGHIFAHQFWPHSYGRLSSKQPLPFFVGDKKLNLDIGAEPLSVSLFKWINTVLFYLNRVCLITFVLFFLLPEIGQQYPVPETNPVFLVTCFIVIEVLSKSGMNVSRDIKQSCNPKDWVVNLYMLGFGMTWLMVRVILWSLMDVGVEFGWLSGVTICGSMLYLVLALGVFINYSS